MSTIAVIGAGYVGLTKAACFAHLGDKVTCADVVAEKVERLSRGDIPILEYDPVDFEPEITAKVLRRGYRIYEVPVSYSGRGAAEGRKFAWRDGVRALSTLVRYRWSKI